MLAPAPMLLLLGALAALAHPVRHHALQGLMWCRFGRSLGPGASSCCASVAVDLAVALFVLSAITKLNFCPRTCVLSRCASTTGSRVFIHAGLQAERDAVTVPWNASLVVLGLVPTPVLPDTGRLRRVPSAVQDALEMRAKQRSRLRHLQEAVDKIDRAQGLAQSASSANSKQNPDGPSQAEEEEEARARYEQLMQQSRLRLQDERRKSLQRHQQLFTIPSQPHNLVELSVPRSGSTVTMALFSVIDNAFILPEPYNFWDTRLVNIPKHMDRFAPPPSVQSLFDCSFVRSTAVGNVFWDYACNNSPWIIRDTRLHSECNAGAMPPAEIEERCRVADLRLTKILRAPVLARQFGQSNLIPPEIKVFSLVRAPWDVFMSQYRAGWLDDPVHAFVADMPLASDVHYYHMDRICSHMLLNDAIMRDRPHSHQLLVRFEDLTRDFDGTLTRLFDFADIPLDEDMRKEIRRLQDIQFAQFASIPTQNIAMTRQDAEQLARNIESCQQVAHQFSY